MSTDTTNAAAAEAAAPALDRAKDLANLKKIGMLHFALVMAALTLWGAADAWAVSSGWPLAQVAALANAVIAAYVISSTLHEWGHYAGARLAGSVAPVHERPVRYFFMFDFPFERNDTRQFLWMSLGGIGVPWLLVLLVMWTVPLDTASRALLLATFVARAVAISVFELPVYTRTQAGGEPRAELVRQVQGGFLTKGNYYGIAAGALVFLAA